MMLLLLHASGLEYSYMQQSVLKLRLWYSWSSQNVAIVKLPWQACTAGVQCYHNMLWCCYCYMHLVSFGGPIVQHSCAMNTLCMQHSFYNCMFVPEKGVELWLYSWTVVFVPDKGWKSAYIGVELWLYSWTVVFVPDKGWKSAYIHVWLAELGVKYSCTRGWTVFMSCFISLEVPYWHL